MIMTDNQNSSLRCELLSRAEVDLSMLGQNTDTDFKSWEQETIFYDEAKHLFLQSLYWSDCAVSEMPKTSRTLCGSDCGQTSAVRNHAWCQSIWTDGGETWTGAGACTCHRRSVRWLWIILVHIWDKFGEEKWTRMLGICSHKYASVNCT